MATKAVLKAKATEIENKIPDTTSFITIPEFNKLSKVSFDSRIKEAVKILASKSHVDKALDIANENGEKMKNLQAFHFNYFIGKCYFKNDE